MYFFLINTLSIITELLVAFQLRGWEPDDKFQIYDVFGRYSPLFDQSPTSNDLALFGQKRMHQKIWIQLALRI